MISRPRLNPPTSRKFNWARELAKNAAKTVNPLSLKALGNSERREIEISGRILTGSMRRAICI
jgi:hypothetical protein